MPFCAAGVECRDIPTCFKTCQKTLCMTGAILLHRFQKMNWIFRGRRSTLDVRCRVYFVNHFVMAVSSGDSVQIARQAWDIMRVSSCSAGATFGAVRPVECNFAWHAQHLGRSTLYTSHSTLYTLHSMLYVHFPIYTHMYTPHLTLHTLRT